MSQDGSDKQKKDPALKAAVKVVAITALVLTVGAALFADLQAALGVFLGGALATLNLVILVRLGEAFLEQNGGRTPWAVIGVLKLVGLFAAVYLILKRGDISPMALVVGFGSLPIGITISGLFPAKEKP